MIIDHISESIARIENDDGAFFEISAALLPVAAQDGDVIFLNVRGVYEIDKNTTEAIKQKNQSRLNQLFSRGK